MNFYPQNSQRRLANSKPPAGPHVLHFYLILACTGTFIPITLALWTAQQRVLLSSRWDVQPQACMVLASLHTSHPATDFVDRIRSWQKWSHDSWCRSPGRVLGVLAQPAPSYQSNLRLHTNQRWGHKSIILALGKSKHDQKFKVILHMQWVRG